jgi:biopolymer transport protein ExbD
MNRNDCEAVLYLHRRFRPRRRTGRGFLTGTIFLDASLLITAFVLAMSPLVRKPGITVDLPAAEHSDGIRFNGMVLTIPRDGMMFFNDEPVTLDILQYELADALKEKPDATLILEADPDLSQSTLVSIYDAAAAAGFKQVFIATRSPGTTSPAP